MKKTIAVIVVLCMALSGTAAFAAGNAQSGPAEGIPVKTQEAKMLAQRLGPQLDKIRENRAEIQRLREEIRVAYEDGKAAIREMIQNRDKLSLEQVEALKGSLECIRESRKVLEGTLGEASGEMLKFRAQARNMNQDGASESLENCAEVQRLRIQEMKRVLVEIEEIGEI